MDAEIAGNGVTNAGELVAQGATLMRIENETMQMIAVQRPRDESRVIKAALAELDLVPENAPAAYYSIPYKERQQGGGYKITKVEGPSIKAAMSLARRWGNCTTASRVMGEDEAAVDIEGVFVDYETNFRVCRPFRVSKFFKARNGQVYRLDGQRELMALQAGASKAMRNAALAGLPDYLVSAYVNRARQIVGGKLDERAPQKTIDAVVRAFGKWNVTQDALERYAKLPVAQWTGTEVADLRGLYTAIQDGQITAKEAFEDAAAEPEITDIQVPEMTQEVGAEGAAAPSGAPRTTSDGRTIAKIKNVDAKAGKTNGKPWTLYTITTTDGEEFVTFWDTHADVARDAQEMGRTVAIAAHENDRGGMQVDAIVALDEPEANEGAGE